MPPADEPPGIEAEGASVGRWLETRAKAFRTAGAEAWDIASHVARDETLTEHMDGSRC